MYCFTIDNMTITFMKESSDVCFFHEVVQYFSKMNIELRKNRMVQQILL